MNLDTSEEKKLVSYLLGDLPEEERDQLEVRFFADPEYREAIKAVEDDLIDEYVRGELTLAEQTRFVEVFGSSPQRAREIAFARALANVTPLQPEPKQPKAGASIAAWWASLLASLSSPKLAFQVALLVATAALVVASLWLFNEAGRLRSEVAALRNESQSQQQREQTAQEVAARERENSEALASQLRREEEQRQEIAERAEQLQRERDRLANSRQQRDPGSLSTGVATFVLSPGMVRNESNEPSRLRVPQHTRRVSLRLDIEIGDEYSRYRAELRTVGGTLVWSSDQLKLQRTGTGQSVVLNLPAASLSSGEYEITLRGIVGPGEFVDFGYYYFTLLKV